MAPCSSRLLLLVAALLTAACISAEPLTLPGSSVTPPNDIGEALGVLPAGAALAYVQDSALVAYPTLPQSEMLLLDACRTQGCRIHAPAWSPDRNFLLYSVGSPDGNTSAHLRLSDRTGHTQTVSENPAFALPADWSPDGKTIVYLAATDRVRMAAGGARVRTLAVTTVPVAEDGRLGVPVVRGRIDYGEGCRGYAWSPSAALYGGEGGFPDGSLAGIVRWAAGDILLYSTNCMATGVGRFDLASGQEMEPLPGNLRSLALTAARDRFAAIDADGRIVTGVPDSLETTVVASEARPDLIFMGEVTGNLYYTTIEVTRVTDLTAQAAQAGFPASLGALFAQTRVGLFLIDMKTGEERGVIRPGSDPAAYAYARVQEIGDAQLIFERIQPDRAVQAALEQGTLTAAALPALWPTADLLRLSALDAKPYLLLANVSQAAFALPAGQTAGNYPP